MQNEIEENINFMRYQGESLIGIKEYYERKNKKTYKIALSILVELQDFLGLPLGCSYKHKINYLYPFISKDFEIKKENDKITNLLDLIKNRKLKNEK